MSAAATTDARSAQVSLTVPGQVRRESFLHRSDVSEAELSPTFRSRRPSFNVNELSNEEVLVVTPFAQLVTTLRNVRNNFMVLNHIPPSRSRRSSAGQNTNLAPISEEEQKKVIDETFDELEWCLDQLECIQNNKSFGHLAANKFKRMLSRELSQLAESSKDGCRMSDYIARTFLVSEGGQLTDDDEPLQKTKRPSVTQLNNRSNISTAAITTPPDALMSTISGVELHPPHIGSHDPIPKYGLHVPDESRLELHMQQLNTWGLNMFQISEDTNGRPLTAVTYSILQNRGLLKTFKIPEYKLINYLSSVESHYRNGNPYHNSLHAADVAQSSHVLLSLPSFNNVFSDLEILAVILGAAVHDVDHPGYTNQFLVNSNAELALMYNDESVLENHHLAVAFKLLQGTDCDILKTLSTKQRQSLRRIVIGLVLATDMSKHMDHIAHLKTIVEMCRLNASCNLLLSGQHGDKIQILESLVHCADLSNPTKPLRLYLRWTECVMEEFFQQGDEEKRLGLDISPLCDRNVATVGSSQIGFIDYIVHPLWETWAELVSPDCQCILDSLESNRQWHVKLCNEDESGAAKKSVPDAGSPAMEND